MDSVTQKALDVFRATFKDGCEVVLEDDEGEFHWGKIRNFDWGIRLYRIGGKRMLEIEWDSIVFIAQDGFPVKQIMGMDYEEAEVLCDTTPTDIIRMKLLELTKQKKEPKKEKSIHVREPRSYFRSMGGGCPFVFEDVIIKELRNFGNNGPRFWGQDDEEELVLQTKNGAIMHSYDMSHIFFFDGLEKDFDIPVGTITCEQKDW